MSDSDRKSHFSSRKYSSPFNDKVWIFLVLGVLNLVFGLVIVGLYFYTQTITTSAELTEVVPGYVSCVVVLVTGSFILVLFWRRPSCLIFVTLILSIGTGVLCVVSTILCVTHILQPITSLVSCTYIAEVSTCECMSSYRRVGLVIENLPTEKSLYRFHDTSNCDVIQSTLPALLYAQCANYLVIFIVCTASSVLTFLILKLNRNNISILREETYEEIFTVSAASSSSESETEPEVSQSITRSASVRSDVRKQSTKTEVTTQIDGPSTCPPGILKNQNKHEIVVDRTLQRSKSCDSLDQVSNTTQEKSVKQGRLKEHRRRERRAVTLNNLDTKQLLLILDLHRRFEEETRLLKSQGNLNQTDTFRNDLKSGQNSRRAVTPDPYKKPQLHTVPRSHTPQPGNKARMGEIVRDCNKTGVYSENPQLKSGDIFSKNIYNNGEVTNSKTSGFHHGKEPSDSGYLHMAPRPKSRPSVQKYFLPPQPIQRCKSANVFTGPLHRPDNQANQLPSRPISRPVNPPTSLPPHPIHRDGSAFQVVGHPLGPMHNRGTVSHDELRHSPGDVYCERAIRDNFKLYASPFILQNKKLRRVDAESHSSVPSSEAPPPYTDPPSYGDFISQDESSQDQISCSENIYETYENSFSVHSDSNQPNDFDKTSNVLLRSAAIIDGEDDVFLPENRNKSVVAVGINSPVQCPQPFIPAYRDNERRRKPKKRSGRVKQEYNENGENQNNTSQTGSALRRTNSRERRLKIQPNTIITGNQNKFQSFDETERNDEHDVYAISSKHQRGKIPEDIPGNKTRPSDASDKKAEHDMYAVSSKCERVKLSEMSSKLRQNSRDMQPKQNESVQNCHSHELNDVLTSANYTNSSAHDLGVSNHKDMTSNDKTLEHSSRRHFDEQIPVIQTQGEFRPLFTNNIPLTNQNDHSNRPSVSSGCTYEDIDDSSFGISSQASLISSSDEISREFNKVIDEIHPGLGDPHVLETMI